MIGRRTRAQQVTKWTSHALVVLLMVILLMTYKGLRALPLAGGVTVGVGHGCMCIGHGPLPADMGATSWAGHTPLSRFRWDTYPGGGWVLVVPLWASAAIVELIAYAVYRRQRATAERVEEVLR